MARTARKHPPTSAGRTLAGAAATAVLTLGILGLALAMSQAIPGPAAAQEQSRPGGFAPEQVEGIEQIVRDYLLALA